MLLLDELIQLSEQFVDDAKRFTGQATALLQRQIQQHPREANAVMRAVRPVWVSNGVAFVTRFDDVVEVLTHDREFAITEYVRPMERITGEFVLGLNQGPEYERAISLLRLAFRQSDVPVVADLVRRTADELVAAARPTGRLDVVKDVCDRVPARIVERFLGAPGPDEDTLIDWARAMFADIFANPQHDKDVTDRAVAASAQARPHVDALVAARKAARPEPDATADDVLGRLLHQQILGPNAFTDLEIRSNLIGLLTGLIPTTAKAAALALDELLRRPDELRGARAAVAAGDDGLLGRYVTEAMRFAPQAPGLIRTATVDYPLARGTHHETVIPAGTLVFAATQSAMMDGAVVESPGEFRLDRPDSVNLQYGAGLHSCFGRFLNPISIPAIVGAVLSLDGIRRAPGPAGELAVAGNFPTSMTVEFTP